MKNFRALTTYFDGRANKLLNKNVGVAIPIDGPNKKPTSGYNAIWDTGATNSVITKKVVSDLSLKPFSKRKVSGLHGDKVVDVYYVDIFLQNGVCVDNVVVFSTESFGGDADILIGMDIISLGDFSVTQDKGRTVMSYRNPSIKKIDYVVEGRNEAIKSKKPKIKSKKDLKAKRKKEKLNKKKSKK